MPQLCFRRRLGHVFGRLRVARRTVSLLLLGLSIPFASVGLAQVPVAPAAQAILRDPNAQYVAEASLRFGIPEHWIRAVMRVESAGDLRAVSSAGAMGLMQIMPDTWAALRQRHRLGRDPFDRRDNILAGAAYLREMFDRYGNIAAMLAAYNGGPGRYEEYLSDGRNLPAETRAYVATLAPILGADALPVAVPAAPAPPPDWREAPLFVARDISREAADNAPQEGAHSLVPGADQGAAEGIFVAAQATGDAP
ncbi:lytic transglycosylase domain-containing protein [Paracoccus pantotrophus]|uniref:Transglycosylase-like protein with SLT domain n=1 Tax=Celeribacter persicus TaxID=1651082 RepID=A0A2T5HSV4_9RHOB|nr:MULTISPECIES: lytic transglycosylase domain-containing protein [Rhodobacterales]PTQ74654.1 transglycosylase-like protein with SLT domain [Celeribacter persicus]RDD97678.1 lytic transglycosylase domain-containing protein [Paracoccus pantotrophus]WGR66646.1 lytic transglycosylase domain-containing protein [Paracoccus pantotrophus]